MWRMSVVFPEPGVPTTRNRRPGGAFSSASLPRSLATVVADDAAVDLEAPPLLASEEREVPRSSLGVFGDAAEASGWVVLELLQPMARVTARVAVIRRPAELVRRARSRELTSAFGSCCEPRRARAAHRPAEMLLLATLLLGAAPRGKEAARERTLASLDALADDLDGLLHAAERTTRSSTIEALMDGLYLLNCNDATTCSDCIGGQGSYTKVEHDTRDGYTAGTYHRCYWWVDKYGGNTCSMWNEAKKEPDKEWKQSGCSDQDLLEPPAMVVRTRYPSWLRRILRQPGAVVQQKV